MFENLTGLGYGLIVFAILIGVGSIVLFNFGGATATCTIAACGDAGIFNLSSGTCSNATAGNCGDPTGAAYENTNYLLGQLGSSGLAGWTPAIIAISVGLLFLGAFMVGGAKKAKGRY